MLLISCEQTIRIDKNDFQHKPVVWGLLMADSVPRIFIYQNIALEGWLESKLNNEFIKELSPLLFDGLYTFPLKEASGTSVEQQNIWWGGTDTVNLNWYEGIEAIKPDHIYELSFKWEGKEIFARTHVPPSAEIISTGPVDVVQGSGNSTWTEKGIRMVFQDNANEQNAYRLRITQAGLSFFWIVDPITNDFREDSAYSVYHSFSDIILDDPYQGKEMSIDIIPPYYGIREQLLVNPDGSVSIFNEYTVSLETMDYTTGKFLRSTDEQNSQRYDPLAEPVLLKTNVENGQGILGGMSRSAPVTVRVPY